MGANSLNLQLEMLHDVSEWKNKNHDGGAIMRYPKGPKKGPLIGKLKDFFHCCYKNGWIPFKFGMEVSNKCNYHHVKFRGPP